MCFPPAISRYRGYVSIAMIPLWRWFLHGNDVGKRLFISLSTLSAALAVIAKDTGKLPSDTTSWVILGLAAFVAGGSKPSPNGAPVTPVTTPTTNGGTNGDGQDI